MPLNVARDWMGPQGARDRHPTGDTGNRSLPDAARSKHEPGLPPRPGGLKVGGTGAWRRFGDGRRRETLSQGRGNKPEATSSETKGEVGMVPLLVLVLILAIFGGLGFAIHVLWYVLIVAILLWLIGFFIGSVPAGGGGRRWYGR